MLFYQHRQIIEILTKDNDFYRGSPQIECYLEDGSLVTILVEWIDESRKGELDERLASVRRDIPR